MIDESDFIAEHPKADMSKVNMIRVNGKEYMSIDRVLKIIEGYVESWVYPDGGADYVIEDVEGLIDEIEALKGSEQV